MLEADGQDVSGESGQCLDKDEEEQVGMIDIRIEVGFFMLLVPMLLMKLRI